jgi:hypothetical protein
VTNPGDLDKSGLSKKGLSFFISAAASRSGVVGPIMRTQVIDEMRLHRFTLSDSGKGFTSGGFQCDF